jgi:hypothetical protein
MKPKTRSPSIAYATGRKLIAEEVALDNAPFDDEPETDADQLAVAKARASLEKSGGKGVPLDEAMRRLRLE